MPIFTSGIKNQPDSLKAMEGATFNSTNFTQLKQSHGRLSQEVVNSNITVNSATVNPFYYLKFFNYLHEPANQFYSALLINRGLQPGEEITISGYFFKGTQPQTNNSNSIEGPITVVFENDSSNTTDFKTKPNASAFDTQAHSLPDADFIGQGIVPVSNGTNVGTLNGGWKYNTTGRSDVAEIQARNADNSGDQTDAALHVFNLSAEGSFSSRFYTITIRNDSATEAFFKILSYDSTGTLNDTNKYFSVHDLRVEFSATIDNGIVEAKSISGKENMDLSIRSDKDLKFEIDYDNDSTSKFKFIGGGQNEVASLDESGNFQLDGQLTVNGSKLKFDSSSSLQILDVINTHNSTAPINLWFTKNKNGGVGHSNDVIADFVFASDDDQGDQFNFSSIKADILSVTNDAAAGGLEFSLLTGNGSSQGNAIGLNLKGSSSTLNQIDVDIAAGNSSVTQIAGNLGVGVSDPDQKLEVAGRIHISSELTSPAAPADGDGGIIYVKNDGKLYFRSNEVAETNLGTISSADVTQVTSAAAPLYIASNSIENRIAIGSSAIPRCDGLHIYTNTANSDAADSSTLLNHALVLSHQANDDNKEVGIGFRISSGQATTNIPGAAITNERTASNGIGSLHFKTNPDGTSCLTRMSILSNGNVGIGTTNPGEKLEVNGGLKTDRWALSDYAGHASDFASMVHVDRVGNVSTQYALLQKSTGETFLNAATGEAIRFRINNDTATQMSFSGAGNLSVVGSVTASNIFTPQYISVTMTSDTDGTSGQFNPFDEDNTSSYASSTHASNGITYTPSNGQFTVSTSGVYEITVTGYLHPSQAGVFQDYKLFKNGLVPLIAAETSAYNSSSVPPVERTLSGIFTLAANDYIEFLTDSAGAGTLSVKSGTTMNIKRIA
tara:strand:- start:38 stop:2722 length:2685 start_codon:yes stop_codon:yes gene_type:complete